VAKQGSQNLLRLPTSEVDEPWF